MNLLVKWLPNLTTYFDKFIENCIATLQMFLISGIFAFIFGLFFGVLLTVFKKSGIKENKYIYGILSVIINIFRSIPFVILLIFLIPFTRAIIGTSIGVKGAIIPLIFGTVPFFARQVETTLENISPGKIEAARSMGSSTIGIIFRVYLHESVPELIRITTITAISLIGLTTMAGAVGAGGLGDFAINYGQGLNHYDIIFACIIVLLIFTCIVQFVGSYLAKKTTNRALFRFNFEDKKKRKFYLTSALTSLSLVVVLCIILDLTLILTSPHSIGYTKVKIGVCGANNDQWKAVQYVLDEQGYKIDIDLVEFAAYNLPNQALDNGEIDLNSFQHKAYLNNEVKANNYKITSIGDTIIAPLTVYSGKYKTLDELKQEVGYNGTSTVKPNSFKIAIPNDATNQGRAIKLLEQAGLIEVNPDKGYTPETADVTKYIYNIEIISAAANTLTSTLGDYAAATINGTYAIAAKLNPSEDGLFTEKSNDPTNPYVNIIVARESDKDNEIYQTIVKAYQTEIVANYTYLVYNQASIPAFETETDVIKNKDENYLNSQKQLVDKINKDINLVEKDNKTTIFLSNFGIIILGIISLQTCFYIYEKKENKSLNKDI